MALDVEAVRSLPRTWLRQIPHGRDPVERPTPPPDGRWQRGSVVDALYLAENEDCMWAEWYRHLAESGIPPERALPRDVWRFAVENLRVTDLSTPDLLDAVGLPLPIPGRFGWPAFQAVGEQLHGEGWEGLIAPSAAKETNLVLCVFLGSPGFPGGVNPVSPARTVDKVPSVPTGLRT